MLFLSGSAASAFVVGPRNAVGKALVRSAVRTTGSTAAVSSVSSVSSTTAWTRVRVAPFSSTSALSMSSDKLGENKPFTTWSFDKPCGTMDWCELVPATMSASTDASVVNDADLVIVGIYAPAGKDDDEDEDSDDESSEDEAAPVLTGMAKTLDEKFGGAFTDLMTENAKVFKNGATPGSVLPTLRLAGPESKTKRYVLMGMGKEGKDVEEGTMTKIGKVIASKCNKEKKVSTCAVVLPPKAIEAGLTDVSTGFYSCLYADNRYRTGKNIKKLAEHLTSVTLLAADGGDVTEADASLVAGQQMARGIFLTKDIVNAPHNILNSESLAHTAKRIAAESGGTIKCTILNKKDCESRGMGAYLGVARGSETEPQFIHLTYTPPKSSGKDLKKVGIVGKGLLFDTGGYNIKTAMMELMKFDCGGAAAVFGAARATAALAPEGVEAHFIVAACENMINEKAMVPSDVLTASNGKTIEIINTDAEGRLTLADALVYADKEVGCESIIELSTLTGAIMVSLGKGLAGVFTTNDELAKELEDVSKTTGDKSWRMPLETAYNKQLESKIADLTNCGTRYGGSITAGLFLQHFVSKEKPFAHIDIAGPVWNDKTGATGFGTKLVTEWIRRQGISKE
eukprot:CAMPEP_0198285918 /NCGR_PEP_ID=MMETSP1449-20131203/5147_1 /TAXON_ID=420275 /ORGANISM="Attheya septentrionalis, Strain CCMP2084" /LENGTH=625 /DNA_ID=CAMNT_0043983531 /DNA_START=79 /DNA_END=1956 /DNA_ORIENTATION=-